MLPISEALISDLAHSGVIGADVLSAVEYPPVSSVLPDIESSGVSVFSGIFQPPARHSVLRPLLTSLQVAPSGSPQVRTRCFPARLSRRSLGEGGTAAFTSATEPTDFAVLCQLVASRRP